MTIEEERAEYVKSLRDLADLFEATPHLMPRIIDLNYYCANTAEMLSGSKGLGKIEKVTELGNFVLRKRIGKKIWIDFFSPQDKVCKRVKVGERVVPAMRARSYAATPEFTENVYEWQCPDSLLKEAADVPEKS